MKTAKKRNILVCLLALFTLCVIGAVFHTAQARQSSATGESYTLTFETGTKTVPSKSLNDYFGVPIDSPTTPTHEKYGENGIKITFSGVGKATINLGKEMGLEANKTYVQTFKFKLDTVSTTELFYLYPYALHFNNTEAPEAPTALDPINKGTKWEPNWFHYANYKNETTWTNTFTYDGTANNGDFVLYFYATSGRSGSIYVWDLTLTEVQIKTVENGTAIGELPEVTAKVGYSGAWTIDNTAISSETTYNYGADKTAVIKYTPVTYTLTFKDIDGNTVGDETYTYTVESDKGTLNKPAVPQIDGKDGVWSGWEEFDVKQGGDKTFTAAYPDVKVKVTFEDSKGENQTVEYAYGAKIGELSELNVTGYVGVWKIGDIEITADYVIRDTEDLTVTAVYTAIEYTITFKILGETEALGTAKYTVETDPSTIVYPTVPEKDGSTDGEWEEVNLKNGGDVTVLFTYAERVTVEFKDEAGNVAETVKVSVGKKIGTLPELPAKKGYTGEWKSGDTVITADTVVTEDMTVNAVYTKNSGCGAAVDGTVIVLNLVALAVCAAIVIRKKKYQK